MCIAHNYQTVPLKALNIQVSHRYFLSPDKDDTLHSLKIPPNSEAFNKSSLRTWYMNCLLLFVPALYPPATAPPANMFGNVPGYEGTMAGGGKRSPNHSFSRKTRVVATA